MSSSSAIEINQSPSEQLNMVIVIPCYNEFKIIDTLNSLWNCTRPNKAVEVIVVINSSASVNSEIAFQNYKTHEQIKAWAVSHHDDHMQFYALFYPAFPEKLAGVGMARRIGMDLACQRLRSVNRPQGILVSLDADCTCEKNYLQAIEDHFEKNPDTNASALYFEHQMDETLDPGLKEGAARFELQIRYAVRFVRETLLKHHFHPLGFAQACRVEAYEQVGRMPMLTQNEDVLLTNELISLGHFTSIIGTTVYPATRFSYRTSGGSTSLINLHIYENNQAIVEKDDELENSQSGKYSAAPNPMVVADIRKTINIFEKNFHSTAAEIIEKLPVSVQQYILEMRIRIDDQILDAARESYKLPVNYALACARVIFLSHDPGPNSKIHFETFAAEKYHPPVPLLTAARDLLVLIYNFNNDEVLSFSTLELLNQYRKLDKKAYP